MNKYIIFTICYITAILSIYLITKNDIMVQTTAVVLTGLVIILYTYETYLLRFESQKQTELQQRPLILASLERNIFSVTNYGIGIAFNVSIKPVIVDEGEDIKICFDETITIIKPGETKNISAESFHRGRSTGNFFLAHLDPAYANQTLCLEILYQNAEMTRYSLSETISPQGRKINGFKIKKI